MIRFDEVFKDLELSCLGELKDIGNFMITETQRILEKEKLPYTVVIKANVWKTHCSLREKEIQYGEFMIKGICNNGRQGNYYYYDIERKRFVLYSGYFRKHLSVRDKIISVMIEEIAHIYPCKRHKPHGSDFHRIFVLLWRRYYKSLKHKFKELIDTSNEPLIKELWFKQ